MKDLKLHSSFCYFGREIRVLTRGILVEIFVNRLEKYFKLGLYLFTLNINLTNYVLITTINKENDVG